MYEKPSAKLLAGDVILNGLSISVLLITPDFEILRVNQATQTLCQCGASKLEGNSITTVFLNPLELVSALRRSIIEERPFTERDLQLHAKGVGSVTVDCHISPLFDSEGKVSFLVLELSRLDRYQRISRSGRVEMDNDLTQELLNGLAHEIKHPLGGIRGAAQLLDGEIGETFREYTQVIIRETDRLKCLVDDMFGPRGESRKTSLNIHDVLEHVRLIVTAEKEGSFEINSDYDPSIPELHADRDHLIQAFLNVVRNSCQAVDSISGKIMIKTRIRRKYTILEKTHRLVVEVQVVDNGPGVPKELGKNIFFPLISGKSSGSGLGLPIAQSLVRRHGGIIDFNCSFGETVFSVWLPLGR